MRVVLEMETGARGGAETALALATKLKLRGVLLPLAALATDPGDLTEAACARLRQTATAGGTSVSGLSGVLANPARQLTGGETTRAAARARLQAVIRLCTELGARLMDCELPAWDTLRGKLRAEQAEALAAETLRACAPLAESRRVTLCLGGDAVAAERLVQRVNHPNIRLACDGATLERLAKPVVHTRLVRAQPGDDPARLGKRLAALGYDQWLALRIGGEDELAAARTWLEEFAAARAVTSSATGA
jgi:Xylose isomerase-like TIM barrel